MRFRPYSAALLVSLGSSLPAQTIGKTLNSMPQHDAEAVVFQGDLAPITEVFADFRAHLTLADAKQRGELWLLVAAKSSSSPEHVLLRIPLANTGDVYGESRSCISAADGSDQLIFTAGMDEKNFLDFAASAKEQDFHLLLNKYLCRALVAPFHCGTRTITLPEWPSWHLAGNVSVQLSADAPAQVRFSSFKVSANNTGFDRARCAVAAPSNGICCVAHKTTEWHCGGTPVGDGWHQVSSECYHRETGGSCSQ